MNRITRVLTHRIAYHIYFWFVVFFSIFLIDTEEDISRKIRFVLAFCLPWVLASYCHFFFHQLLFLKRKYFLYILSLILIIVCFGYLSELSVNTIISDRIFERSGMIDTSIIILITTALRYFKKGASQQVLILEAEKNQLKSELQLLKFQVNPHFLFNTLNTLFSISTKNNDTETANGLLKLASMMRYMIYESNVDRIELQKEISHIEDFMAIQNLRFSGNSNLRLSFVKEGDLRNQKISPMILIPFIENAFKHGISIENPSFIEIRIVVEDSQLDFKVSNSINTLNVNKASNNSGIGLVNVKKRLELLYLYKHTLTIRNENNQYQVHLRMEL